MPVIVCMFVLCFLTSLLALPGYHIYLHISCRIYDKIMPQKLGGDLSAGHKIKTFFSGAKICNFQCTDNK